MEPQVTALAKSVPDNVVVRPVPIPGVESMQRMYYTLEALDRLDLHGAFFHALHDERKPLYELKDMADWAAEHDIDKDTFKSVFNSFGVNTKVARANELTDAYKVEGTPTFGVGGRYVTSPSMTGSYESTITQVRNLINMLSGK